MSTAIQTVVIKHDHDDNPDLSWLDQTDAEMGDGFEASAQERKEGYGDDWFMIGIRAEATIIVNGIRQTISSPGLWGIESDSGRDYFADVAREELDTLRDILTELCVTDLSLLDVVDLGA